MESKPPRSKVTVEGLLQRPEFQEILKSSIANDGAICVHAAVKSDAQKLEEHADAKRKHQDLTLTPVDGSVLPASSTTATFQSCKLRIGQHPPELKAAMEDLRCKTPAKIASLRRILVEKEQEVLQLQQIRQLEAELKDLKQIEAQLAQYEKMSVEELQQELETLQQQVANLTQQIESALQNELKWAVETPSRVER